MSSKAARHVYLAEGRTRSLRSAVHHDGVNSSGPTRKNRARPIYVTRMVDDAVKPPRRIYRVVFRLYQRWLWIVERAEVELDMTLVEAAFLVTRRLAHRILPKQSRYCACNVAVEQVDGPAVQVHGRLCPTKLSRPRGSQTWRRSKVDHVDTTGQRTSWLFPLSIAASRRWGVVPRLIGVEG